jgi:cobalamin biosynthesis Mg chelatase CobN
MTASDKVTGASGTDGTGKHKADEVLLEGDGAAPSRSPEEIQADIEQQREELAETLDALSAKLDVKAQAQAKAQDVKATTQLKVARTRQRATTETGKPRPEVVGGVVLVVVAVAGLVWWRRSR